VFTDKRDEVVRRDKKRNGISETEQSQNDKACPAQIE
jgi:hypothetical protein